MTPTSLRRVPNQPKTPLKSFRIPEALYVKAQEVAAARDETVSDVVRRALERYTRGHRAVDGHGAAPGTSVSSDST